MAQPPSFGTSMRKSHFSFSPTFTPLNHGSFGATPRAIEEKHISMQRYVSERPDVFIIYKLPALLDESRKAIAPLLRVAPNEFVFVPNATTGVNTVLRNLKFEEGDVIVHLSTIYDSCEATVTAIGELTPLRPLGIPVTYPIEDADLVTKFKEGIVQAQKEGKNVKIAIFDTVSTFPGVKLPWEDLVAVCKELGVLSLVDGAHGLGNIDLTHVGQVSPGFFVSNCHKCVNSTQASPNMMLTTYRWLYVPRSCAVFHVPFRNQYLIRSSIPTSYASLEHEGPNGKSQFVNLFDFVATMDHTPYTLVPEAIKFREEIGGEEAIRKYCWDIARRGGQRVAEILDTEVMDNKSGTLSQCAFVKVRLPLKFRVLGEEKGCGLSTEDAGKIKDWIKLRAFEEADTYLQLAFYAGSMWVRLSGQIYVGLEDFEMAGNKLKELCERLTRNPRLLN